MRRNYDKDVAIADIAAVISQSPEVQKATTSHLDIITALQLVDQPIQDENTIDIINALLEYYSPLEAWNFYLEEWKRQHHNVLNLQKLENCLNVLKWRKTITLILDLFSDSVENDTSSYADYNYETVSEKGLRISSKMRETINEKQHSIMKNNYVRNPRAMGYRSVVEFCDDNAGLPTINWTFQKVLRLWSIFHIIVSLILHLTVLGQVVPLKKDISTKHAELRTDILNAKNELLPYKVSSDVVGLPLTGKQMPLIQQQIVANSYNDFQKKMHQHPEYNGQVDVLINLSNASNWPVDMPMQKGKQITKISFQGSISIYQITSILKETTSVKEVHLLNADDILCQTNKNYSVQFQSNSQILLHSLKTIHFENFNNCNEIFYHFSSHVVTKKLESIDIKNSVIDTNNVKSIATLLSSQKASLKNIKFLGTKWNEKLFARNMPMFDGVTTVYIDFITRSNLNDVILGIRFHDIFPSLQFFTSSGPLTISEIRKLMECRNLVRLTVKVVVPNNINKVSLSFLRYASSELKYVKVFFHFVSKSLTDYCEIEGIDVVKKQISLTVGANCQIKKL